jgi:hypothetical protein
VKYLEKSFSIYPSVRTKRYGFVNSGKRKVIDPNHEYINLSGMCGGCALSKEGHNAKYPKASR